MKFLFVGSNQIDILKIGGIENSVKELTKYLIEKEHRIVIFKIDKKKNKEVFYNNKKLKIIYGNRVYLYCKILFNDFGVINFIQTPFENIFFTILFFLRKVFSKTIVCKFFFTYPPFKKYAFFAPIKYKLLIDKCFVFSKRLEKQVLLKAKDVTFLYPPVSKFYINSSTNKTGNKTKILFAGRLSKEKGLNIIIDVYKKLDRNQYFLGLMGYYKNAEDKLIYSTKIADLNLDYMKITKISKNKRKNSFLPLNQYDIMLLPYQSLYSTLDIPLLVLEGLISGCTIITSNIGDLSNLDGNIFTVKDYSNPSAFEKLINNINMDQKNYNYESFYYNNVGKKYLSSIKSDNLERPNQII